MSLRSHGSNGWHGSTAGAEREGPKIAYFSESILPWVDGVSRTLGMLFDHLEANRRDYRIYAPIKPSDEYAWSRRVRQLRSVPFPLYRDYRVSMPDTRRLRAELDVFAPDLIHVSCPTPAGIWAQAYAKSRGIPVVGGYHTHFVAYLPYYHAGLLAAPGWALLRWFYNRCDATLAPSSTLLSALEEKGIRNGRHWGRGIDTDLFSPARRDENLRAQLGLREELPLLLMVSRIVPEKDLGDLVAMDAILRRRGLSYKLALVGSGPMRDELRRRLSGAIFPGQKVGMELARWYASADVFVFPSTTEVFGNVIQEAMASELPVVVVDKWGPPGVIEPGLSGLVARSNNPRDLADKVSALIVDSAARKQMGAYGRKLALERTWSEVNAALLREYDSVLEEHRRPSKGAAIKTPGSYV